MGLTAVLPWLKKLGIARTVVFKEAATGLTLALDISDWSVALYITPTVLRRHLHHGHCVLWSRLYKGRATIGDQIGDITDAIADGYDGGIEQCKTLFAPLIQYIVRRAKKVTDMNIKLVVVFDGLAPGAKTRLLTRAGCPAARARERWVRSLHCADCRRNVFMHVFEAFE